MGTARSMPPHSFSIAGTLRAPPSSPRITIRLLLGQRSDMKTNRGKFCGLLLLSAILILVACSDERKDRLAEIQPKFVDGEMVWKKNGSPFTGTWKHEDFEIYLENGIVIERILRERVNGEMWCRKRYLNGELIEKEWQGPGLNH